MPTTESNARSIACAKGYGVEWRSVGAGRRLVAYDLTTGETIATAATWSEMLRALLKAPRAGEPRPAA
jgi:hypothetical protein